MTPRITLITTGGTIASQQNADGSSTPSLDGQALLARLGDLPPVRLRVADLMAQDSSTLTLADMQAISDAAGAELAGGAAGVMILHGTDAMEETALLLSLQHPGAPVVLTGAQFTDDHPQADGPANMAAAIRAVLDGGGVRLAFGGRLLPAWGLVKHATDSADAFRLAAEAVAPDVTLRAPVDRVRVDLVAIHPGADATHLDASLAAGAQGIVLAALGSGNASAAIRDGVARAHAAGVPVVISSRVPMGRLAASYGGGGGGHDLVRAGAVLSRVLRPGQARVLLAALIAAGQVDRAGELFG
ncbi:asparaginase domain-containing protein [Paracoccus sp. WLY502]|uniref:asparaginase domain-containing protein n=1 Tax=Paracoccus yibinensis TaxID=3068891 RepID=UPI0027964843|nr:asparaginase domain-containing protein [Paracoccus sp. WLY502]MDQ1901502.1 asparaginase domain-containing protein [Paracoccus sp. WLY502]